MVKGKTVFLHLFSKGEEDISDGGYKFNYEFDKNKKVNFYTFQLYNNFYNITEYNNSLEITENSVKIKIYIPIGNYNLEQFLNILEIQLNEKTKQAKNESSEESKIYNVKYNINKNRIQIVSKNNFNIKFIDNPNAIVQMRELLGYSKIDYLNNNNYQSDLDNKFNIYDDIYINVNGENSDYTTIFQNQESLRFSYFEKININILSTFCKTIDFVVDKDLTIDSNELILEFYLYNGIEFKKINQNLHFNIVLKIN